MTSGPATERYRAISADRLGEFVRAGLQQRYFFPHRFYFLPKAGPDGLKMAQRMCAVADPNALWEVLLYADGPALDGFPDELFFDDEIVWHRQHGGRRGQVASANLVIKGRNVYGMNYLSDLVQRIGRRREFKSQVENRFRGWPHLLLNSILDFALERGLKRIYSPTADWTIRNIPASRPVKRELFERIYDRAVTRQFQADRKGPWWVIDVDANRDRRVAPARLQVPVPGGKTICLAHDIERGMGHARVDPGLAAHANQSAHQRLGGMLGIERRGNVRATYSVVGCFLDEIRARIEADGHCLAFHTYDHRVIRFWPLPKVRDVLLGMLSRGRGPAGSDQLARVREVDYRIKGYRPARSKITRELSDRRLCFHNFEWLASSAHSLGSLVPGLKNRIVKIPILLDDFDMYARGLPYEQWERRALQLVRENDFVALSLHDCYADFWLPRYEALLAKLGALARFKTMDELASETFFAAAQ